MPAVVAAAAEADSGARAGEATLDAEVECEASRKWEGSETRAAKAPARGTAEEEVEAAEGSGVEHAEEGSGEEHAEEHAEEGSEEEHAEEGSGVEHAEEAEEGSEAEAALGIERILTLYARIVGARLSLTRSCSD